LGNRLIDPRVAANGVGGNGRLETPGDRVDERLDQGRIHIDFEGRDPGKFRLAARVRSWRR